MSADGDALLAVVEAYASLGDHRTGWEGDRATGPWLARELAALGAEAELRAVAFDRYACEWEVRLDGEVVEALPLFYAGVGSLRSAPALVVADPRLVRSGATSTTELWGYDAVSREATAQHRKLVVFALDHPLGLLAVPNRRVGPATGMPAIQVAARHRDQLDQARVEVDLDARVVAGASANVVARFGAGPMSETVVVTTPISGWFRCAGERGTGIAVALALAESVAAHRPVLFLGATGHELGTLGAALVESEVDGVPRAVVHVGANAACVTQPADGAARLWAKRPLRMAGSDDEVAAVEAALASSGWLVDRPSPPTDPASWQGEAATWASRSVTLLSVIDANPYFHTPEDLPDAVTTQAMLAEVTDALATATLAAVT